MEVEAGNGFLTINGLLCKPIKCNSKRSLYTLGAMKFETHEELIIANLLVKMDIPFLHHLQFVFQEEEFSQPKIWCPDFIFFQPWWWVGRRPCNGSAIIGIEVKRRVIEHKVMRKSIALCERHGIPILILTGEDLAYYQEKGRLPLKPIRAYSAA
ncbi:hypothetical protein C4546_04110 [Candidatus Parcubacteria bacterium]|nr:MAG: hypothetical protein C4546_04110 [Candidatus Parcubacteria bacterium]